MKFKPDRVGIESLKYERKMYRAIGVITKAAAIMARANAPVRSGHYVGRIRSWNKGSVGRIYVNDFKVLWIEYGAGPSPVRGGHVFPAHHVLKDAIEVLGLRYEDAYLGGRGPSAPRRRKVTRRRRSSTRGSKVNWSQAPAYRPPGKR